MQGSETKGVFSLDSQKVKLQVAALTKKAESYTKNGSSKASSSTASSSSTESSKKYSIEVYNAAYVSGLAKEWETYLDQSYRFFPVYNSSNVFIHYSPELKSYPSDVSVSSVLSTD